MIYKKQLVSDSRARAVSFGTGNPKKFITVHQTGNPSRGANAQTHANLQSRGFSASWHWQVDDKEAIQSFDHTWRLFHAGDGRGKGNMESIGIESCINSDGDYVQAVKNTAKLVAKIMKDEGIPISRVVQHNYWSGKNCPAQIRAGQAGINWNKFIQMVKENLGKPSDKPAPKPTQSSPTYYDYPPATYEVLRAINSYEKPDGKAKGKVAKGTKVTAIKEIRSNVNGVWLQLSDKSYIQAQSWTTVNVKKVADVPKPNYFKPYLVRVRIANLNIRAGAGTNHQSYGFIKPGVYTIVEEKAGAGASKWGKLKSGAGWISLDYTEKDPSSPSTPEKLTPAKHKSRSGTWKFTSNTNIRSGPSTSSSIISSYSVGQTVNILDTLEKNGYIWGQYIGATSGQKRYVALGTTSGTRYGKWV